MSEPTQGSQWDTLMSVLIEGKRYINWEDKFENEIKTIEWLNENPNVSSILSEWLSRLNDSKPRSTEVSAKYRNEGNILFNNKNVCDEDVVAELYTQAIFSAPENTEELALAHANRAAIFMKSFYEEEAYYDCEMAVKFKYPQDKLYKLLQRKLSAAIQLNKKDFIAKTIEEIENLSKTRTFSDAEKLKLETDKLSLGAHIETHLMKKIQKPMEEIANKKLIEKKNIEFGRYILAGEPIEENDPILQEKAFAFIPVCNDYTQNAVSYHCQMCASTNSQPFPCYKCCRASYCSPKCCEDHQPIHKFECVGYQKNLWRQIGIAHLALRNFLVGFNEAFVKISHLKNVRPHDLNERLIRYAEDDRDFRYGEVLRLVTNFDKMDMKDVISYALTAKLLVTYLNEHAKFFDVLPKGWSKIMSAKEDWVLWTAALILKHLGQLISNGHAISDMEIAQPSILGDTCMFGKFSVIIGDLHITLSSTRVFTAIFPKISLLNHSCDPNIWNCFNGPYLTIYASRQIKENEEIYNCYGPHYKLMDKEERQTVLQQQYCFKCKCTRCQSDDKTVDLFLECTCSNTNCRSPLIMDKTHRYWWTDEELSQFTEDLVCAKCDTKFIIDGDFFKKFMQYDYYAQPKLRPNECTEQLIKCYGQAIKHLGNDHEMRQKMAQVILHGGIPVDDRKIQKRLAEIALDNLNTSRKRYGVYSMEFVMASTYVLDAIARARTNNHIIKGKDESFFNNIKKMYDLPEIIRAFKILSTSTRKIFLEYMTLNVVPKEAEVDRALIQLWHDMSVYEKNTGNGNDDAESDIDNSGSDSDDKELVVEKDEIH